MKTLLKSMIAGIGMIISVTLEAHQSQFNLKMFDNSAFSVKFDGAMLSQQTPQFTLTGISCGPHKLDVAKFVYNPYCGKWEPKVIFCGSIAIPEHSKVFAMINCEGQYVVNCVEPMYGGWNQGGGGWSGNNGGWGGNYGGGQNTGWNPHGNGPNDGGGYQAPCFMSPESFQMLKCAVESKPFDNTKLEIAEQAISMNNMSAQQVSCLMGLMTFDHYKLDLAKYAYKHTVDKQNYFMVNSNFTFSSSISELNYYIAHI